MNNASKVEIDQDQEQATIQNEYGSLTIGTIYNDKAKLMPGLTFSVDCKNPQGFVYLSYKELQKLFEEFHYHIDNAPFIKVNQE